MTGRGPALRARALAALLGVAVLAPALSACGTGVGARESEGIPATMTDEEVAFAQEVVDRLNAERAAAGVPPLEAHAGAGHVAYRDAVDMDVRGFFSHVNPDGLGPSERLAAAGVPASYVGENIAQAYPSPQAVVDGWMSSDSHRENVLDPNFAAIGVGVHLAPGGPWWVTDFFRP